MGLLDAIGGLFGFGGGGGSTVSYGVVSTVQGGDRPVGLVSTIEGGARPVVVDLGLRDVNVDVGLDDVNLDVGGTGTPLHSIGELRTPDTWRTSSQLAVTQPIISQVDAHLDVEPVQVDLCVNVGLTKLPRACIQQPYSSRFGVTILGTEVVGFTVSGRSDLVIDELTDRPHLELGAAPSSGDGLHVTLT